MNGNLIQFDYAARTRIVFGNGSADRAGELAASLDGKRILLVTDRGIVAAGHAQRVSDALRAANLHVTVFDAVHENPTTRDVDQCLTVARDAQIDLIIGLGGGSSLDTAKGCNFLFTNGGRMHDYWGVGKATKPMLPLIAMPTTAGTGSECQSFALIADETTHQKMACGDPKAAPQIALLDPTLTLTQPAGVTACTGIDAVAHAVESYVCNRATPLSRMFAAESFRLTHEALPIVLDNPTDLDARGRMLLGAALAGCAIENSMLGAAHAAANPLTARFNIVHGRAVGWMLPFVIQFNSRDPAVKSHYAALAAIAGLRHPGSKALHVRITALLERTGLSPLAVPRNTDLDQLAAEAAAQWTAGFNPRPIARPDFLKLYASALKLE